MNDLESGQVVDQARDKIEQIESDPSHPSHAVWVRLRQSILRSTLDSDYTALHAEQKLLPIPEKEDKQSILPIKTELNSCDGEDHTDAGVSRSEQSLSTSAVGKEPTHSFSELAGTQDPQLTDIALATVGGTNTSGEGEPRSSPITIFVTFGTYLDTVNGLNSPEDSDTGSAVVCRVTIEVGETCNVQCVDVCVDSGATLCLLSTEKYTVLQKTGWATALRPAKSRLQGASGACLAIAGITDLRFRLDGVLYNATVYVGKVIGVDLLLGVDWLRKEKAIIDFGDMSLSLPPHKVFLRTTSTMFSRTYAVTTPPEEKLDARYDDIIKGSIHGFVAVLQKKTVKAGTAVMVRCMVTGRWPTGVDARFEPALVKLGDHVHLLESLVRPQKTIIRGMETHLVDICVVNQGLLPITIRKKIILGYVKPLVRLRTERRRKKAWHKTKRGRAYDQLASSRVGVYHLDIRRDADDKNSRYIWHEEPLPPDDWDGPTGETSPPSGVPSKTAEGMSQGKGPLSVEPYSTSTKEMNAAFDDSTLLKGGIDEHCQLALGDQAMVELPMQRDAREHPPSNTMEGLHPPSSSTPKVEEGGREGISVSVQQARAASLYPKRDLVDRNSRPVESAEGDDIECRQYIQGQDPLFTASCPIQDGVNLLVSARHDVIDDGNKLAKRGLEESASGKTCEKRPAERGGLSVHVAPVSLDVSSWDELKSHLRCMLPDRRLLTPSEAKRIIQLVQEFEDIFVGPDGKLGWTDQVKHKIQLEGCSKPHKSRPRAKSAHDKKFIEEEVARLLKAGKIRPSKSPWGAPVVLVRKKDGTLRFCIDFRELNEMTKKDAYPIPRIDELLDCLNGSQWFCTLDLASGYWQIAMWTDDIEKTAFTTHAGLFEWVVMPFGLCNAPATFCRLMETVLSDIMWSQCLVYLDDIIAFGKTFQDTLDSLRAVFVRLRANHLKLKAKKCELFRQKVDYLGHEVSNHGIRPSPTKINSLHDIVMPRTVTQIKSFIGVCSYYRRFIPNFAEVAVPLSDLTKKGAVLNTDTKECVEAFEQLKALLLKAPMLHYIDPELPFVLDTDASDNAIGACLGQTVTEESGERYERPIAFASKTLVSTRRRYCTTKKELYAVVYYMNYWKNLLSGGELVIRTDHYSLLWLLSFGKRDGTTPSMYFRWAAQVTIHSMVKSLRIIHRPGAKHLNADGMSRLAKASDRRLRIPEGERMNGCTYSKCADCAQEAEYNKQARGSDSEDSDDEEDLDGTKVTFEDVNDLPVYYIDQLRYDAQLQITREVSYLVGGIPVFFTTTVHPTTAVIVEYSITKEVVSSYENETTEAGSVLVTDESRRSERIARNTRTATARAEGLQRGVKARPTYKSYREQTDRLEEQCSLQKGEIDRLKAKIQALEVRLLDPVARKSLGTDIETQVDAHVLGLFDGDAIGPPLLDDAKSDELDANYKYIEKEIERVAEVCPSFSDEEWMKEQLKDPVLARVREIVGENDWRNVNPVGVGLPQPIGREVGAVKAYLRILPELVIQDNGVLCWREPVSLAEDVSGVKYRRLVPHVYRVAIFQRVHRHELRHYGYEKVYWALRQRFWWTNMSQDVLEWCQACESCQNAKPGPGGSRNPLRQDGVTYEPLDRLGIDLVIFTKETWRGNRVLLVVQDYASKWIELFGLPNKEAKTVEQVLHDEVMLRYGACLRVHSDQGREFDNELLKLQLARWGIDKTRTSGYAPWSNGMVERSNRSLKGMLRQIGEARPEDWDEHLPKVRAAINNAVHSTTGHTPRKVFFSQCCDAKMPIDLMACEKALEDDRYTCMTQYIVDREKVQCEILKSVRTHMNRQMRLQADNAQKGTSRIRPYKVGDFVLRKCGLHERDKLGRYIWRGPCEVFGVSNSSHLVKILVPATGRPKAGQPPTLELRWINTSNVKPCKFDKDGRLLIVQEFITCDHQMTPEGGTCEKCSQLKIRQLDASQDGDSDGEQPRVMEDDPLTGTINLVSKANNDSDSYADAEHYLEYVEATDITPDVFEWDEQFQPDVIWNSILQPGEEGPKLPYGITAAFYGGANDLDQESCLDGIASGEVSCGEV